jgi:mannose-1-phosphate guanylyltransferase
MKNNYYCIIMAGGIGSRFWPLSKISKPKQFLDILGIGKTLLQSTFERFNKIFSAENIFVVTSSIYEQLVVEQLPQISRSQILLEPIRRNTAPCIAYASFKIRESDPDAVFVVAPSDHLIIDENAFLAEIRKGFSFVEENDVLLTLGLQPTRAETGYGYIQFEKNEVLPAIENLRKVKTFTEKPDSELARVFVESGEFYWNSGIFLWSANAIIKAIETYLPEVAQHFNAKGIYWTEKETDAIIKIYSNCRNVSVDYGIMEKAENVYVLTADFGWSDLGTWGSLYEHAPTDKKGNAVEGENVFLYETNNSVVKFPGDKIVVLQGLDDYIVVESENILLVCRKGDEQKIKNFVNDVKMKLGENVV